MKRFIQNIAHELKGPYLNRRKLELQCFTSIFFGQNDTEDILEAPCWVMVINIVALDMLRSQLPEAGKFRTWQTGAGLTRRTRSFSQLPHVFVAAG